MDIADPRADDFYRPPIGWEHSDPGAVLSVREVDVVAFGRFGLNVRALQVLYRSADLTGAPSPTVTTILIPQRLADDPVIVAYQVAIDAIDPRISPSYALRRGARMLGQSAPAEVMVAAAALSRGWVVSICDHGGPNGHWLAPREPGHRVLDGVRATMRVRHPWSPASLADAQIALWGFSGGGIATLWAAALAREYASELQVIAALVGSPPTDLRGFAEKLHTHMFSGVLVLVVASLRRAYPDIAGVLRRYLTPVGERVLAEAEELTMERALFRWLRLDFATLFRRPWAELLAEPVVDAMLDDAGPPLGPPSCPTYIYQPVFDEFVGVATTDRLVDRYRAAGGWLTYRREVLSEHFSLAVLGVPAALVWLDDRVAGRPPREDSLTTLSTLFSVRALIAGVRWVLGAVSLLRRSPRRRPLDDRSRVRRRVSRACRTGDSPWSERFIQRKVRKNRA